MKSKYEKVGLEFNVLGMLDIQGISNFSENSTLASTWNIYSEFISVIENNDYVKKYEKEGLEKFLLGDALYFYFDKKKNVLKKIVYLMSSLFQDSFLKILDISINHNDIPLSLGDGNKAIRKKLIEQGYLDSDGNVQENFTKLDSANLGDFLKMLKNHEKEKIFNCICAKINMPYLSVRAVLSVGSVYGQKDFPIISKSKDTFDVFLGSAVSQAVAWEKRQKWFGASTNNEFEKNIQTSELSGQLYELKDKNYLIEYAVPTNTGLVKTLAVNFIKESSANEIKRVAKEKLEFYKNKNNELFSKMYETSKFIEYVVNEELFLKVWHEN